MSRPEHSTVTAKGMSARGDVQVAGARTVNGGGLDGRVQVVPVGGTGLSEVDDRVVAGSAADAVGGAVDRPDRFVDTGGVVLVLEVSGPAGVAGTVVVMAGPVADAVADAVAAGRDPGGQSAAVGPVVLATARTVTVVSAATPTTPSTAAAGANVLRPPDLPTRPVSTTAPVPLDPSGRGHPRNE